MGDDLTVWESTQGIFQVRKDIARAFKLPFNRVRVMKDYMGGVRCEELRLPANTYACHRARRESSGAPCAASSTAKVNRPTRAIGPLRSTR
jgi:CO/xanthine dehydrogenase Mo-binding subunit